MEEQEGLEEVTRDSVKLIVEQIGEELTITYAQLDAEDLYHISITLVEKLAGIVGQEYNQVLDDLKEIEEESK